MVDELARYARVAVRFSGGSNAGHTIVVEGRTYALHLLPSGIVRGGLMNIVGPGVVFDLAVGDSELKIAASCGSQVLLDHSTPIVLPVHRALDAAREASAGSGAIGTTKRGIGPAYSDFWLRRGATLGDLRVSQDIRLVLEGGGWFDELVAVARHLGFTPEMANELGLSIDPLSMQETIDWCAKYGPVIVPHLGDTRAFVHNAIDEKWRVLFEGSQGVLLDTFHGSRPHVTSSSCTLAGVSQTFGVYRFDRVYGVAKAYCTRVGAGPFPTELNDEVGAILRDRGREFGTTTGRPRRCGWLDIPALRYAVRMGGITHLCLTKLDVLSGLGEVRVCIDYLFSPNGLTEGTTLTGTVLRSVRPHLIEMPGWIEQLNEARHMGDLPSAARCYIDHIERVTGVPVSLIGVGPGRNQIIKRK